MRYKSKLQPGLFCSFLRFTFPKPITCFRPLADAEYISGFSFSNFSICTINHLCVFGSHPLISFLMHYCHLYISGVVQNLWQLCTSQTCFACTLCGWKPSLSYEHVLFPVCLQEVVRAVHCLKRCQKSVTLAITQPSCCSWHPLRSGMLNTLFKKNKIIKKTVHPPPEPMPHLSSLQKAFQILIK